MTHQTLGQIVLRRRNERGVTQRDLATLLGIKASHIAYIENGHRKPSIRLIAKLARVLRLDPLELLQLAHPETRAMLAGQNGHGRKVDAWREFSTQKSLLRKHAVTDDEMAILKKIHVGQPVTSPNHFIFLLTAIRSARA